MIRLISEYDKRMLKKYNSDQRIWAVTISYYGEPEHSMLRLFADPVMARRYFDSMVPDEKDVQRSEVLRCKHFKIDKNSNDYIHNRQYFVDNGYYENWDYYEWAGEVVMTYYCDLAETKLSNNFR